MKRVLLFSIALLACNTSTDDVPDTDPGGSDTDIAPTGTDTSDSDTDSTDTDPPLPEFDCATIPQQPTAFRLVPGARGYHDVDFDGDGNIIGASAAFNSNLMKADYAGNAQVWVPNTRTVQQFAWLPDGDLAVSSDSNGIVRIAPNGGSSVINGNIRPYGLILGPDEMLYAADQSEINRVDPVTGDATRLLAQGALQGGYPRVINFSLDNTKMFIGTYQGSSGRVYVMDLDANYDPISEPTVFATGVGSGAYHDTLGVDICGYLYVADYSSSSLYRISPQGTVRLLLEAQGFMASEYGHGMNWGTGEHGWLDDAIYLSQPYNGNTVTEVVIGVPSRDWDKGVAVNLP